HAATPMPPMPPDQLDEIADDLQLSQQQRDYFRGRKCPCLFFLADLAKVVKNIRHVKGRNKGKPDFTKQNAAMLDLFDTKGNAVYDRQCVMVLFGISSNR